MDCHDGAICGILPQAGLIGAHEKSCKSFVAEVLRRFSWKVASSSGAAGTVSLTVESAPMQIPLPRARLIAWITMAALLVMMWSAMSQARLGARVDLPWTDICSVSEDLAAKPGAASGKSESGLHAGHCVFCGKHDLVHLLPARFELPQPLFMAPPHLTPESQQPRRLSAWLTTAPRGPPDGHC